MFQGIKGYIAQVKYSCSMESTTKRRVFFDLIPLYTYLFSLSLYPNPGNLHTLGTYAFYICANASYKTGNLQFKT